MSIPVLVTIGISHYCEIARWSLERYKIAFEEQTAPPAFHRKLVSKVTQQSAITSTPQLIHGRLHLTQSSDILQFAQEHALSSSSSPTSVPLLLPIDPKELEEVKALQTLFVQKLGVHTRRFAYYYLLQDKEMIMPSITYGASPGVVTAFGLLFWPIRWVMKKGMKIDDEGLKRSVEEIDSIFTSVSNRLDSSQSRYLVGKNFTAADLSFAALAAPVLIPSEYRAVLPSLEALEKRFPEASVHIKRWRESSAGQHGLRMYAEERNRIVVD